MANAIVFISSGAISNGSELVIPNLSATYVKYEVIFSGLYPAGSSQTNLVIRTSTDNGISYASSTGDYTFQLTRSNTNTGDNYTKQFPNLTLAFGQCVNSISNTADDYANGVVEIFNPMNASAWTTVMTRSGGKCNANSVSNNINYQDAIIQRQAAEANNAVKLLAMDDSYTAQNFYMRYLIYGYLA